MCVHVKEEEEEGWVREGGGGREEGGMGERGRRWEGGTRKSLHDHHGSDLGIGELRSAFALLCDTSIAGKTVLALC